MEPNVGLRMFVERVQIPKTLARMRIVTLRAAECLRERYNRNNVLTKKPRFVCSEGYLSVSPASLIMYRKSLFSLEPRRSLFRGLNELAGTRPKRRRTPRARRLSRQLPSSNGPTVVTHSFACDPVRGSRTSFGLHDRAICTSSKGTEKIQRRA